MSRLKRFYDVTRWLSSATFLELLMRRRVLPDGVADAMIKAHFAINKWIKSSSGYDDTHYITILFGRGTE